MNCSRYQPPQQPAREAFFDVQRLEQRHSEFQVILPQGRQGPKTSVKDWHSCYSSENHTKSYASLTILVMLYWLIVVKRSPPKKVRNHGKQLCFMKFYETTEVFKKVKKHRIDSPWFTKKCWKCFDLHLGTGKSSAILTRKIFVHDHHL